VAGGQGAVPEPLGLGRGGDHQALGQVAAAGDAGQGGPARLVGLVDERAALGHQTVEQMQGQRQLAHQRLHLVDAAEPAHQLLERQRASSAIERHHLAVEGERRPPQVATGDGHHVGQAAGDVAEPTAPDPHAVPLPVELDPGSVVLELQPGAAAVGRQRFRDVGGQLGQHGQQRHEEPGRCRGQPGRPLDERQRGHRGQVAEEERGAPHQSGLGTGRLGNGLQHQTVGDARAHLATDDVGELGALERGRPGGQGPQLLVAQAADAGAAGRRHRGEGLGHLADRERRPAPGRRQLGQAAHVQDPRIRRGKRAAGEEGHRGGHLARGQRAEVGRDQAPLVEASRGVAESPAQRRQLAEGGHGQLLT
jgi:hypothetical protein